MKRFCGLGHPPAFVRPACLLVAVGLDVGLPSHTSADDIEGGTSTAAVTPVQLREPARGSGGSTRPQPAASASIGLASAPATLHSHGEPTLQEQLMLELINRARANPGAEAARLGIDLNAGLPPGTIADTPKPPLAFHALLIQAARVHSQWMLDQDVFDHYGAGGSDPGDRMTAAGYPFQGGWQWGENIAWKGTTGSPDLTAFTVANYEGLFRSPGHRKNLLDAGFDEIGLGVLQGVFTKQDATYNAVMVTQNLARSDGTPGPLLLGVVYRDSNGNAVYDVGEGVAGVTVRPERGAYYAVTSSSGGYAIPFSADAGLLRVTASGGALVSPITRSVTLGGHNVKLDFELLNGWPIEFVVASARRWQNGHFECQITGPAGQRVEIQVSGNLRDWTRLTTLQFSGGSVTFTDVQAPAAKTRFYRARPAP